MVSGESTSITALGHLAYIQMSSFLTHSFYRINCPLHTLCASQYVSKTLATVYIALKIFDKVHAKIY